MRKKPYLPSSSSSSSSSSSEETSTSSTASTAIIAATLPALSLPRAMDTPTSASISPVPASQSSSSNSSPSTSPDCPSNCVNFMLPMVPQTSTTPFPAPPSTPCVTNTTSFPPAHLRSDLLHQASTPFSSAPHPTSSDSAHPTTISTLAAQLPLRKRPPPLSFLNALKTLPPAVSPCTPDEIHTSNGGSGEAEKECGRKCWCDGKHRRRLLWKVDMDFETEVGGRRGAGLKMVESDDEKRDVVELEKSCTEQNEESQCEGRGESSRKEIEEVEKVLLGSDAKVVNEEKGDEVLSRGKSSDEKGGMSGDGLDRDDKSVVYPVELQDMMVRMNERELLIVDVRSKLSYTWQKLHGSVNYPFTAVEEKGYEAMLEQIRDVIVDGGDVVVYDAGSVRVEDAWAKAGTVVLNIQQALVIDGEIASESIGQVRMLRGGFSQMYNEFPGRIEIDCSDRVKRMITNKITKQPIQRRKKQKQRKTKRGIEWNDILDSIEVSAGDPARILPYLYIGSSKNSGDRDLLNRLGITHCLVVGEELKKYFESEYEYKQVEVKDLEEENLEKSFGEVCQFLDTVREKSNTGAKVLVHCYAGISRSVTCTVAYLIWLGYGLREAMALVKEKRKGASPNEGFLKQLQNWELTCLGI